MESDRPRYQSYQRHGGGGNSHQRYDRYNHNRRDNYNNRGRHNYHNRNRDNRDNRSYGRPRYEDREQQQQQQQPQKTVAPSNLINRPQEVLPEPVSMAKLLIASLGNYTESDCKAELEGNLVALAGALVEGGDLKDYAEAISDIVLKCFAQLYLQSPILSTLLALLAKDEPEFAQRVAQALIPAFQTAIEEGDILSASMQLRGLAGLACAGYLQIESTEGVSYFGILSMLLEVLQSSTSSTIIHAVAYLISSTLPLTSHLHASHPLLTERITSALSAVLQNHQSIYDVSGTSPLFHVKLSVEITHLHHPTSVVWDSVYDAIRVALELLQEPNDGPLPLPWRFSTIQDELASLTAVALNSSASLDAIRSLLFQPSTSVLCGPSGRYFSCWCTVRYVLCDNELSEHSATAGRLSLYQRHLAGEMFRAILRYFDPIIRPDGTSTGSIKLCVSHLLSVFQFFDDNDHIEYVLVEVLLLLLLQRPAHNPCLLHRVILELCAQNTSFLAALAVAANGVFELLPVMDISSMREFSAWFSMHMMNSQLAWPYWETWAEDYSEDAAKKSFLNDVIQRCTRLSVPQRLQNHIPDSLHCAIPLNDGDFSPKCPLLDAAGRGTLATVGEALRQRIEDKLAVDEVSQWLEADHDGVDAASEGEYWRAALLTQTLLAVGCKTLSSLTTLLDRYQLTLLQFADTPNAQKVTIETLDDALGHQPSLLWLVLDLFLRRGVVSPRALSDYLISQRGPISIANLGIEGWVWDIAVLVIERSVDIANACVALMKRSAPVEVEMAEEEDEGEHHSRKRSRQAEVSEEVLSAVDNASATCKHVYTTLLSATIGALEQRRKALPVSLAKMDHQVITAVSLVHRICSLYHTTQEKLTHVDAVEVTVLPEWTDMENSIRDGTVESVGIVKKFWK